LIAQIKQASYAKLAAMHASLILQVALPLPLPRTYDYLAPVGISQVAIGARVRVPFGARRVVGFVMGTATYSKVAMERLKAAIEVLDQACPFPDELFQTLLFASRYYHHSIGEVLANALPTWLREGRTVQHKGLIMFKRIDHPQALNKVRGAKQKALLTLLGDQALSETELNLLMPGWRMSMKLLESKQWVQRFEVAQFQPPTSRLDAPLLNTEQECAVASIEAALHASAEFSPFLLDGITGSGKTEVYLRAASAALAIGKSVLVLVPEIGLTPQTLRRFRDRLACTQAALHSQLSDGERAIAWMQARRGEVKLILGTRSAVFAPLKDLGLIIVDEEHDLSYKQQDSFRYHARDIALKRAASLKIPVILGSATPSLETIKAALDGRFQHLKLTQRAASQHLPVQQLIDLREQDLQEGLSNRSIAAIKTSLLSGAQVLVLRNRRGFAAKLECHSCGYVAQCPNCERALTLHRAAGRLRCHYCDLNQALRGECAKCKSTDLFALGVGTQRIEDLLQKLFPEWPCIRIDRDSVSQKGALEDKLDTLQKGDPCIVIGTQMMAKGHDLPQLGLVVVIGADDGLHAEDFRASERLAQLLVQVAGRAGRSKREGLVLIQTHQPDHPLLQMVMQSNYASIAETLLSERASAEFPPHYFAAMLRADAAKLETMQSFLSQCKKRLLEQLKLQALANRIQVYGPIPAGLAKRAGRYRGQLIVIAKERAELHSAIGPWISALRTDKQMSAVHYSLDIDPYDFN
jgi:primosomal protein N' (replication factor Y) (superfamily II helicase)